MKPPRHPCRPALRPRDWVSVLIMVACLAGLLVPVINRLWFTGKVVWRYQNITVVKTRLTDRLTLPDALRPTSVDLSLAVSVALTK